MILFLLTEDGQPILTQDDFNILCESAYVVTTDGRNGIGIVQPQSGIDYPLIQPSPDIRYLLADVHVSFNQPSDYANVSAFARPYRIYWLSGFGSLSAETDTPASNSVSVSSSLGLSDYHPTPTHGHDIVIVDANDQIVFDSTHPETEYATREWTDRLRIVTWQQADQFVAVSYHTAWSTSDFPSPREYSIRFFPDNAVLDDRVCIRQSKHVRSLTAILDRIRGIGVELHSGYNMQMLTEALPVITGQRKTTRITFNAMPGGGLGVYPDCDTSPLVIQTINNVQPTQAGQFHFAATDCYWVRQPTRVIDTDPRTTMPEIRLSPGNIPTTGLPDAAAGTSKNVPGWPTNDNPRYAHLQFGNDCPPCCDCDDYVDTARYMNTVRNRYQRAGKRLEGTRDLYHANRTQWTTARTCILQRTVRMRLVPQLCPFIDVSLQFCNQTGECFEDVILRSSFFSSPGSPVGVVMPGFSFITGATHPPGTSSGRVEPTPVLGTWPTFDCTLPKVGVGHSAHVRFRLSFANCGVSLNQPIRISGAVIAICEGFPLLVLDGDGHTVTATGSDEQTLRCPGEDNSGNWTACSCGD